MIIIIHTLHAVGGAVGDLRASDYAPSGYPDAGLILYLLAQAAVGHWRLQGPGVGRVQDGISCIAELLINPRVLRHIGRGGGVDHQAEQDDEERQQVESGKLKQSEDRDAGFTQKGVCKE